MKREIKTYSTQQKYWLLFGWLAIAMFIVALINTGLTALAQGQAEETHFLRENGFLTRWLALGPFIEGEPAPKAIEVDYLLTATGVSESKFATLEGAPKAGDSVSLTLEGYATQRQIWQMLELPEDGDVDKMLVEEGEVDFTLAYLLTFIKYPTPTLPVNGEGETARRILLVGSDDSVKVWLNGEVAHTTAVDRSLTPDQDKVAVELKKGLNCLMLKVADSTVDWQLTARFEDGVAHAVSLRESGLQFFDTPERQMVPLWKRLIRPPNPQLALPSFPPEFGGDERGGGTEGVWKTYRSVDGLANNYVRTITQDKEGAIWVGTQLGGASRFDGKSWKTFTQKDGLANNFVPDIIQDKEGAIWFGTGDSGVSRYDGKRWKTYTQKDGLASNAVLALMQDKEGTLWFGTMDGGVSRFDGRCFQIIDSRDGLANDFVLRLYEDKSGQIWIGTFGGGAVRFIPNKVPPSVYITQMVADKTYDNPKDTIQLRSGIPRISVSYHAISFKTRPGAMKYFYQLAKQQTSEVFKTSEVWQGPTNEETVEYFNLKPGEYTFKVQAVDRDLNYSEPASVSIVIPSPPFYQTGIFLMALSITGGVLLIGVIILAIQRWRATNAEKRRLLLELEDAHRMQIRLLPEGAPTVEGFEIAGFCRLAREVGGDFFDYLSLASGKIGLALADVSGKGLKGAMNAVLASGMLHEVAKIETSCGKILSALNADLHPRMEKQMFTALGLAILNQDAKTLQWANATQPYPIIKQEEQVFEFEREGGLPLSIMPNVSYPDWELELQAGDIVIFYTDGIIEAQDESEEMYGTERLKQVIAHIDSTMNAEEMINTILHDVALFVGTAEQYDDMTVVVVKKV
ncbi:hypothetical protein FJZ31_13015 [Candidatus Poribacteria bacterium]|nr:hypothetical protein [Candidatus Poribacteria bacterium]